ncbi:VOC family protein [Parasulfitobacter algicola]|uniref:VOC family protein n=1 Tax=Parasulfitobacter algicola TaxID=2614809 RepID=A0ABX2IL89_9RHOB|nr:VOC family protein [Sulfitobacter algicola]NSX53622.1 VOC family protein [Sulfitobacter algicola]
MTFHPDHFTVWIEIPVTDMARATKFYEDVLLTKLRLDETGPNPVAFFVTKEDDKGIAGHLYPGKPAPRGTGSTVHLITPDTLEDTMKRVKKAGGQVLSPAIPIPSGRFFYIEDLDGNSVGFFEVT